MTSSAYVKDSPGVASSTTAVDTLKSPTPGEQKKNSAPEYMVQGSGTDNSFSIKMESDPMKTWY